ncbi:MAG: ketopantoate reductase family protein [Lachnospiraceae bacterium]
MKILVYGAGVIGSFLCHVLCDNGHDVTLLARGKRKELLDKEGLVLHHYFGGDVTTDHPVITDSIGKEHYDVIFAVMQYKQLQAVLDQLIEADADTIVCVGNNMHAKYMAKTIREKSEKPKDVLFGFQGTGGERTDNYMVSVSFGSGSMTIGPVSDGEKKDGTDADGLAKQDENATFAKLKEKMEGIFAKTEYTLNWVPDMDSWYKCHLAFVLPGAYLSYILECNLYQCKMKQVTLFLDAVWEAHKALKEMGYMILPEGNDTYFKRGPKRFFMMAPKLFVMTRTKMGELAMSNHCKNAVGEMEDLSDDFSKMLGNKEDDMKAWKKLKEQMPSWKKLHKIYD